MPEKETDVHVLETRRDQLAAECESIQHQIDMAHARRASTGEYAPAEWYAKASHALRCKRREYNNTLKEIADAKKLLRQQHNQSIEKCFVQVAKRRLDPELFSSLMDEAQAESL